MDCTGNEHELCGHLGSFHIKGAVPPQALSTLSGERSTWFPSAVEGLLEGRQWV
jgi:hypothetical protein